MKVQSYGLSGSLHFYYTVIKVGVCTWSHVEAFRHAGFKGKATDGAAFKLGRRERGGKTDFIIVKARLLLMVVQLQETITEMKPDRGRKDTNEAPARDRAEAAPHSVLWKKTLIAALGQMNTDTYPSHASSQWMNRHCPLLGCRTGNFFCNFSQ